MPVLIALGNEMSEAYRLSHLNQPLSVLLEEPVEIDQKKYWSGFSKEYIRVFIPYDDAYEPSDIVTHICTRSNSQGLL